MIKQKLVINFFFIMLYNTKRNEGVCMLVFKLRRMTDMLYEQWDMGKEKSKAIGKTCAYIYIFEILSETEKLVLKYENKKLVGYAGYSKWNSKKHFLRKKFYGILAKILINSPLVKNKQAIHDYNEAYDSVPEEFDGYFDGEISILIVDKKYRGKGYGKELLSKVFELAGQDNMRNIQILTDESCNYEIYEKFGCKKLKEVTIPVGEPGRSKEENYIYEKVLKEGE